MARNFIVATLVAFLSSCIPLTTSLRFCYNNEWHQTGSGCKLGIAFPQPVPIYCAYEDNPYLQSRTTFQSDACTDKRFRVADIIGVHVQPSDYENFAHNLPELQVIYIQDDNESPVVNATIELAPDVVDLNECVESCGVTRIITEELDPSSHSSSSSEESAPIDAQEVRDLKEQTLRLGDYMYDITFDPPTAGEGDGIGGGENGNDSLIVQLDYRIVDLFKRSLHVISGTCPGPFLPPEFNRRLLNGFLFLLSDSGTDQLDDITVEEYQDIRDALDACKTQRPGFSLQGMLCTSKTLVERIIVTKEDGTSESYPFKAEANDHTDYYKYDLFIDAAWKVVDIVHAVCFVQFHPNSNMHHRYQTAMELLFTPQLQKRQNPTKLINNDGWGSWFLVDINSTLLNLHACQRAAYLGTPFSMRLDRPFHKHRYRRDLSYRGNSRAATRLRNKRSIESYWEEYEKSGGIQSKLGGHIYCFKSQGGVQGRNEILEQLHKQQCGRPAI